MRPLEAMARAICMADMNGPDEWTVYLDAARAALTALRENISDEMVSASCATMSRYIRSLPKEQLVGAKMKQGGYLIAAPIKHRIRLEAALLAADMERD